MRTMFVVAAAAVMVASSWTSHVFGQDGDATKDNPPLNQEISMTMTNATDYDLMVKFTYNPALPACDGTNTAPLTYFYKTPTAVIKKTGFKMLQFNWNPCGHPPFDNWGIGHFDVHLMNTMDPGMINCGKDDTGAWIFICTPDIPKAKKFFEPVMTENVPTGFVPDMFGVFQMGNHYFIEPTVLAKDWVIPAWIMGDYAGETVFFEQMFPVKTFTDLPSYSANFAYNNQNWWSLPYHMDMTNDKTTMTSTMHFHGKILTKCPETSLKNCESFPQCEIKGKKCVKRM